MEKDALKNNGMQWNLRRVLRKRGRFKFEKPGKRSCADLVAARQKHG
jgi:hypothetical protein